MQNWIKNYYNKMSVETNREIFYNAIEVYSKIYILLCS